MTKDVTYIYGVIASGETMSFGPIGIGERGDEVHTVPYRDLAAVVSDCPAVDYGAVKDKERIVRDLAAHQAVIEEVMKRFTVLPIKFGTTVKGQDEVKTFLRQGHFILREAHAAMESKVEVEVVVAWDLPSVFQEISAEEPIAKLRARIEGMSRLRSTPERVKVGKMVYESLNRRRESCQQEVLSTLAGCVLDLQKNSLMNDEMVMNIAFLLDKGRQKEFDRRLDELDEKLGGRLDFRRIGPLPPYSTPHDPTQGQASARIVGCGPGSQPERGETGLLCPGPGTPPRCPTRRQSGRRALCPDRGGPSVAQQLLPGAGGGAGDRDQKRSRGVPLQL